MQRKGKLGCSLEGSSANEAGSLLARVEYILGEVKQIAADAKKAKDWPAATATAAFREMRGCLELLGKVTGELQQQRGGELHLHCHAHIHTGTIPKTEIEIDLEIVRHVPAFQPLLGSTRR